MTRRIMLGDAPRGLEFKLGLDQCRVRWV